MRESDIGGGDDHMVIRKEDVQKRNHPSTRRAAMKALAHKIADRNDEALKRLSKN